MPFVFAHMATRRRGSRSWLIPPPLTFDQDNDSLGMGASRIAHSALNVTEWDGSFSTDLAGFAYNAFPLRPESGSEPGGDKQAATPSFAGVSGVRS